MSTPRAAAVAVAAIGLVNLVSGIFPAETDRLAWLEGWFPVSFLHSARTVSVLMAFTLLSLARGLWRRKRIAWGIALTALLLSSPLHLFKGADFEEALLNLALATWLWSRRSQFHARSDKASVAHGLRVLAGSLAFTLAYGTLGLVWLDTHFRGQYSWTQAPVQVLRLFFDLAADEKTPYGDYFTFSVAAVGAVTLVYAAMTLLRPVTIRRRAEPVEQARAAKIVQDHGRSTMARFTLFPDKSYFFSSGASVVAFVQKATIALALGDPIGPAEDIDRTLEEFASHCAANDWSPAFYQVLPDYLDAYRKAGYEGVKIGHEAIVDLHQFSTAGKAGRNFRAAQNKLTRLGYRTEILQPPLDVSLLGELRSISDEWLAMMHGSEKRFSLGWFDEEYIGGCPVILVRDQNGGVCAFANLIREYQRNELTVDLMRRRSKTENGLMMFLFVQLFEWAREQGYDSFNLGLSPLAGVGEQSQDPALEKGMHFLYKHLNGFYSFEGLHEFKERFHPEWSPRYLVFPGAAMLPQVASALVRADSGDDFLWRYLSELAERGADRRPEDPPADPQDSE